MLMPNIYTAPVSGQSSSSTSSASSLQSQLVNNQEETGLESYPHLSKNKHF